MSYFDRRFPRAGLGRMALLAALLAGSILTTPGATGQVPPEPEVPEPLNILIIVTDDQRTAGTMQVMPETLTRFGTEGTAFTRAFATTPTCCPSRASIFTGRYAHNHGVHTSASGQAYLLDQTTTLQRHLSEAGYLTGHFGKFLNEWARTDPPPYFDRWASYGSRSGRAYKNGMWNLNGAVVEVDRYSTYFLGDQADAFIDEAETDDERPWFLYLAPIAPHAPSEPARRHQGVKVGPFEPTPAVEEVDIGDKPGYVAENQVERSVVTARRRKQLRTLMSVDEVVSSLFKRLERTGELDNTLAFFLSDNGFLLGEHGITGKRYPYLDSVSIPFYVRWPERIEPGAIDDRLVATIDIAPTVYEATGLEPDHVMDGRSFLDPDQRRERLLLEHWSREERETPDWASFISESDQYVEYYLAEQLVVTFREYYDLLSDPWQNSNLFGDGRPANDPEVTMTSIDLIKAIGCIGTTGTNPCP